MKVTHVTGLTKAMASLYISLSYWVFLESGLVPLSPLSKLPRHQGFQNIFTTFFPHSIKFLCLSIQNIE